MIIDYNPKIKRFVVQCSFAENSQIDDLVNKRFQRRTKVWYVAAVWRNAETMLERWPKSLTPEALVAAREVLKRKKGPKEIPFPGWYAFKTPPYPHQREALDRCWGLDTSALFMEMGTGKTKVAADLNSARIMDAGVEAVVVLCPVAVRENWVDEWQKHCPLQGLPVFVVESMTPRQRERFVNGVCASERFVIIAGIESMQGEYKGGSAYKALTACLKGRRYSIVVDESHLVKNADKNRSRNAEAIAEGAQFKTIMTGTPITANVFDLYQQFQVLDPEILGFGNYYGFRSRYAVMGGYENKEIVGHKNLEELMDTVRPYVYECTKKDKLDLPDKLYTKRMVTMSKEQARVYKELDAGVESMVRDMSREGVEIELIVDQVLAKYNALQQITGGFVKHTEEGDRRTAWLVEPKDNPKIRELVAVLEENPGAKVIVWAKFRDEIAAIVQVLSEKYGQSSVVEYHGGVPAADRPTEIARFKNGGARFFVANQQTGGTGLTINESNLVVYFSNGLKLVDRAQSEDRNHRIGQKSDVLYIDLVCRGSVDVDIIRSIANKKDVADFVREQLVRSHGAGYNKRGGIAS